MLPTVDRAYNFPIVSPELSKDFNFSLTVYGEMIPEKKLGNENKIIVPNNEIKLIFMSVFKRKCMTCFSKRIIEKIDKELIKIILESISTFASLSANLPPK
jgi:hypothetical protein